MKYPAESLYNVHNVLYKQEDSPLRIDDFIIETETKKVGMVSTINDDGTIDLLGDHPTIKHCGHTYKNIPIDRIQKIVPLSRAEVQSVREGTVLLIGGGDIEKIHGFKPIKVSLFQQSLLD